MTSAGPRRVARGAEAAAGAQAAGLLGGAERAGPRMPAAARARARGAEGAGWGVGGERRRAGKAVLSLTSPAPAGQRAGG